MNLEIYNRKDFLSKPNLDDHTIEYYSNVKESRFDNVEFKGFIEFDYNENTRYSYYGQTSIDDKHIYLTVKTFESVTYGCFEGIKEPIFVSNNSATWYCLFRN